MERASRILLVDDEAQVVRVLRAGLAARGHDVRSAADGASALEEVRRFSPDLVITDLSMREVDGIALCRRIREASDLPIIVLSARGEERTKVHALDAGADDYVTKPFGMKELLAHVRAALRRAARLPRQAAGPVIEAGDFRTDLDALTVTARGRPLPLTPREYDLLVHFVRNAGKVLTHRALLAAVWGAGCVGQAEYLRVVVHQLRFKVEEDPLRPRYIITEPWTGYRFDPGPD